jgi:CubicO group peptidase (beta-lactamase class C family)
VEKGKLPGLAAAVFINGKLTVLEECGFADIEARSKMRSNTLVRLYSMTKCVIASVIMQLVDEGHLDLETELSRYIPAFGDVKVVPEGADGMPDWERLQKPRQAVRLRHLLTHTSGLMSGCAPVIDGPKQRNSREKAWTEIYGPLVRDVDAGAIKTLKHWVNELAKLPLVEHPGIHYEYGYSYDVLGHIIELVTGKELKDALRDRVFEPLGMKDTVWDLSGGTSAKASRLSTLYRYTRSKRFGARSNRLQLVRVDPPRKRAASCWKRPCRIPSGGGAVTSFEGGLLSTLDDYSKFLLAVTSGGRHPGTGVRLMSPRAAKWMLEDQSALLQKRPPAGARPYNTNGLGLCCIGELLRKDAPMDSKWFDGVPGVRQWGGAASTAFKSDPNDDASILAIVVTQVFPQEDGTVITNLVKDVRDVLEKEEKKAEHSHGVV